MAPDGQDRSRTRRTLPFPPVVRTTAFHPRGNRAFWLALAPGATHRISATRLCRSRTRTLSAVRPLCPSGSTQRKGTECLRGRIPKFLRQTVRRQDDHRPYLPTLHAPRVRPLTHRECPGYSARWRETS